MTPMQVLAWRLDLDQATRAVASNIEPLGVVRSLPRHQCPYCMTGSALPCAVHRR